MKRSIRNLTIVLVLLSLAGCAGTQGTPEQSALKTLNAIRDVYNAMDNFFNTEVANGQLSASDYNHKVLPVLSKAHGVIDSGYSALEIYRASHQPLDLAAVNELISEVLQLIAQLQALK